MLATVTGRLDRLDLEAANEDSLALAKLASHRAGRENVVVGIAAWPTGAVEADRALVSVLEIHAGKRGGVGPYTECVVQGAGTPGVIAEDMGEQQAPNGIAGDAGPVDPGQDWLDVAPRTGVDDDGVIAVVNKIDMSVERIGQAESHLAAADQLDMVRQLHERVRPSSPP